jgi:outer membrane protein OmpA-like peptidoglycan-associated protein
MREKLQLLTLIGLVIAMAPACASKGFVREEVGAASDQINGRVDTLASSVEETQERTRANEQRIGEVDQRAMAANDAALDAQNSAEEASTAARQVNSRVDSVVAASRRLILEVTLNESQGNFAFGGTELPEAARARLDQLVRDLQASPQNVFIEIEGHTDSTGPEELNMRLGLERAEAVKRYLYEQHGVPLHKMNVISFGEASPAASNDTRDGRAQNRRVVIRVLT